MVFSLLTSFPNYFSAFLYTGLLSNRSVILNLRDKIDLKSFSKGDLVANSFEVEAIYLSLKYRSGTLNSNTVNSKFHLIRSFFEIFARFLSFHV